MEKLFMSAGIVVTIVVCLIGIVKIPFNAFKTKHPKTYKVIFTSITLVLSIGLTVLDELYILKGSLISIDFCILICAVLAGVFCGYNGIYEGLGAKELVRKIVESIKKAKSLSQDKKVVKYLNKIIDIDKAIMFLEEKRHSQNSEV